MHFIAVRSIFLLSFARWQRRKFDT